MNCANSLTHELNMDSFRDFISSFKFLVNINPGNFFKQTICPKLVKPVWTTNWQDAG
jgi:hypothetical protein